MHYEIFLDLLFAENLLLNYTILRLSSFLLKRSATRRRSFAAAALGSGYAVLYAVFARYLPGALLGLHSSADLAQFFARVDAFLAANPER